MRSKDMKNGKILAAAAIAFAALAAAVPAKGSTGDIVDIRAVDTAMMRFGTRNSSSEYLCTAKNPLKAGEDLYIRVRMLVSNHNAASHGLEDPKTWYFE